jgi:hypothetical protein
VAAEADVGQPGTAAVGQPHDQGEVVEGRAEPAIAVDARGDPRHLAAEGKQQEREGAVELVAEAPPPRGDDLAEQVVLVQRDGLGQVDAQVLERHGHLMSPVQDAKRRLVEDRRTRDGDPVQVGGQRLLVHHPP